MSSANKAPRNSFQSKTTAAQRNARVTKLQGFKDEIIAIRRSYAERIAKAAREMQKAAATANELEKEMLAKCKELTGDEDVEGVHIISYQPHGSIEDQMENLGEVLNAGLEDVIELAREMADSAEADVLVLALGKKL
jgi:hypothetical protein